jgi:hypothetical protein
MSRTKKDASVVVGGAPRVDLLPPEVRQDRRAADRVRRSWFAVVALVIVVGISIGLARVNTLDSEGALLEAQGETTLLLAKQSSFADVKQAQADVALGLAAQQVAGSTDVDWSEYFTAVQDALPADVVVTGINLESSSPLATFAQGSAPLQGPRVATLAIKTASVGLPDVSAWLTSVSGLPGYSDALPGLVEYTEDGYYETTLTLHVDADAYSHRFDPEDN